MNIFTLQGLTSEKIKSKISQHGLKRPPNNMSVILPEENESMRKKVPTKIGTHKNFYLRRNQVDQEFYRPGRPIF